MPRDEGVCCRRVAMRERLRRACANGRPTCDSAGLFASPESIRSLFAEMLLLRRGERGGFQGKGFCVFNTGAPSPSGWRTRAVAESGAFTERDLADNKALVPAPRR